MVTLISNSIFVIDRSVMCAVEMCFKHTCILTTQMVYFVNIVDGLSQTGAVLVFYSALMFVLHPEEGVRDL